MKRIIYILASFSLLPAALQAQFLFYADTGSAAGIFSTYSGVTDGGPGVIVFDLNGDGWDDIYVPGGQDPDALFLNMKNGTFKDITPENIRWHLDPGNGIPVYPRGGMALDYDNDGLMDLYVTCERRDILWHNNGDGTFT